MGSQLTNSHGLAGFRTGPIKFHPILGREQFIILYYRLQIADLLEDILISKCSDMEEAADHQCYKPLPHDQVSKTSVNCFCCLFALFSRNWCMFWDLHIQKGLFLDGWPSPSWLAPLWDTTTSKTSFLERITKNLLLSSPTHLPPTASKIICTSLFKTSSRTIRWDMIVVFSTVDLFKNVLHGHCPDGLTKNTHSTRPHNMGPISSQYLSLFSFQAVAIAPIQYVPVYYYYPVPILEDHSGHSYVAALSFPPCCTACIFGIP